MYSSDPSETAFFSSPFGALVILHGALRRPFHSDIVVVSPVLDSREGLEANARLAGGLTVVTNLVSRGCIVLGVEKASGTCIN